MTSQTEYRARLRAEVEERIAACGEFDASIQRWCISTPSSRESALVELVAMIEALDRQGGARYVVSVRHNPGTPGVYDHGYCGPYTECSMAGKCNGACIVSDPVDEYLAISLVASPE